MPDLNANSPPASDASWSGLAGGCLVLLLVLIGFAAFIGLSVVAGLMLVRWVS